MASYHDAVGGDGSVVVDDLTEGSNDVGDIQDIVRLTFKAFHDVLLRSSQGDAIQRLEASAEGRRVPPGRRRGPRPARRRHGAPRLSVVGLSPRAVRPRGGERASAVTRAELDEMALPPRRGVLLPFEGGTRELASRQYADEGSASAREAPACATSSRWWTRRWA